MGSDKEEICTPSQFMAASSPYFKALFYPPTGTNRKEVPEVEPQVMPLLFRQSVVSWTGFFLQIFRKILDYLFRGRVPLGSIEDAWRVSE